MAYVRTSKNGEPRVLPLTDTTVTELARHHRRTPSTLVFESPLRPGRPMCFESAFRRAVADAQITDFRFHDLRHTAASYLAQSGASLLEIADVLGHKQLSVVRRYAHLSVGSKAALVGRVLGSIR
jgi:integrase